MAFCDGVLVHPQDTILMRECEQPQTSEEHAGDVLVDQGLIHQKRLAEEPDPSVGIGESDERHATIAEGQRAYHGSCVAGRWPSGTASAPCMLNGGLTRYQRPRAVSIIQKEEVPLRNDGVPVCGAGELG